MRLQVSMETSPGRGKEQASVAPSISPQQIRS